MEYKDKTDTELVEGTYNTSDKASVEMMRRLKDVIEESGSKGEKFSVAFVFLAVTQIVIALWQLFNSQGKVHWSVYFLCVVLFAVSYFFTVKYFRVGKKK